MYERRAGRVANCGRVKVDKDREREREGRERQLAERRGDERGERDGNGVTCVGGRKRNRTAGRIKEEGSACERDE